jgi:hypothetical protein
MFEAHVLPFIHSLMEGEFRKISDSSKMSAARRRLRAPGKQNKRVQTGCMTCRRRKKKCDERHPICVACARNQIACTWPEPRSSLSSAHSLGDVEDSTLSTGQSPDLGNDEAALSVSHIPEASHELYNLNQHSQFSRLDELVTTAQSLFFGPSPKSSDDPAHHAPQNVPNPIKSRKSSLAQIFTPLRLIETDSRAPVYELLDRYINVTAPRLVVYPCNRKQNPFVELLIPVAFKHQIVLDSLLALAAAHTTFADSRFLYGSVVSKLRLALSEGQSTTDVLISTMMLCFLETAEGESKDVAITHLEGLVRILHVRHRSNLQTEHDDLVIEFLLYHCIATGVYTSSATSILAPLLPNSGPEVFTGWAAFATYQPKTRALTGLSWAILMMILNIYSIWSQRESASGDHTTDDILEALRLADDISSFQPLPLEAVPDYMAVPEVYNPLVIAAKLWQIAAFMSLLMMMNANSLSPFDSRVVDAVDEFVTTLASLPAGCAVETSLNWPLVVAGSYAVKFEHRKVILDRFRSMEWLKFRNMQCASQILRATWQKFDESGEVDVTGIMGTHDGLDVVLS